MTRRWGVGGAKSMSRDADAVLKQLQRVFDRGTTAGLNEGALLERFVSGRDESAFAALVARHGPMVLGVCRRILHDERDIEDAFQATFLVLVRRAADIRQGNLVGHWLHVVAHKVAVRARAQAARRHLHESAALNPNLIVAGPVSSANLQWELCEILDEELARLPSSLREPMVLCYLEGLTHDEAALRLHWPVGTVRSRMSRARELLRRRLTRRGVAADGGSLATVLFRPPVPAGLIDSTVESCLNSLSSQAVTGGALSSTAAVLARGVIQAMAISKLKIVGAAALAGVLALGGVQTLARQFGGDASGATREERTVPIRKDRRETPSNTYSRIEKVLADLENRNHDVLVGLDSLRQEVAALRASEARNLPVNGPAPADITRRCPAQMIGNCISCHLTKVEDPSRQFGWTKNPPLDAGAMHGLTGHFGARGGPVTGHASPDTAAGPVNRNKDVALYFDLEHLIFVASHQGDRVAVYQKATGQSTSLHLPVPEGSRHELSYKSHGSSLAPIIKGPKITRVAVYYKSSGPDQGWYPQDLREPVDQADPRQIDGATIYSLGRYLYAFSERATRWDVLELPERKNWLVGQDLQRLTFTVKNDNHLYAFNLDEGKWHDIDLNAILNAPPSEPKKADGLPGRGLQ